MKIIISVILCFLTLSALSQKYKVDIVIKKASYSSYFNYELKEPIFVAYKLYMGGGDCNRSSFRFMNDTQIEMATDKDYSKSGYDKGHMANSEDFAFDCAKDEETFRYYNCLPQTPRLNRGIWKTQETSIRRQSKKDSLLIICGGIFDNSQLTLGQNGICIPTRCWKISQNLRTKKIERATIFTNDFENPLQEEVSINQLQLILGIRLPIKR